MLKPLVLAAAAAGALSAPSHQKEPGLASVPVGWRLLDFACALKPVCAESLFSPLPPPPASFSSSALASHPHVGEQGTTRTLWGTATLRQRATQICRGVSAARPNSACRWSTTTSPRHAQGA
jgi:hypothetical protein